MKVLRCDVTLGVFTFGMFGSIKTNPGAITSVSVVYLNKCKLYY